MLQPSKRQALEGLTVADFSWVAAGPLVVKYLVACGATAIHIESNRALDPARATPPFKDDVAGLNNSALFMEWNCNKLGVTLNLSTDDGRDIARRIVAISDIAIENFTPGVMSRMGLGYEDLKKVNPSLIMLSLSMQGNSGPLRNAPGTGSQLAGLSGFVELTGWPDRPPVTPYGTYTDYVSPPFAVSILLAALEHRRRTGEGLYIDLSQLECCLTFLEPLILDYTVNKRVAKRMGNRCENAAPHGVYRCRGDQRYCAITVFTDEEWNAFCGVIGATWSCNARFSTLLDRKKHEDELDCLVEEWTVQRTPEEVMSLMQAAGVAAGVVARPEDVLSDPQLNHREAFKRLDHPEIGQHVHMTPGFKLSRTPCDLARPGHCMGEHNSYVYTELLGISDLEFVELLAKGVFD